MARARTIKPGFWTSEQVTDCSVTARLLLIGLWNFCDDGGRMLLSIKNIKMWIFPADDISSDAVRGFVAELSATGLIQIYEVDNKQYLQVTAWKERTIDKPSYLFPDQTGRIPTSHRFYCRKRLDAGSRHDAQLASS